MNVNLTPQAVADLVEIHRHITEYSIRSADRVVSRIRQVIEIFSSFPLLGRPGSVEDTREFAVPGLPYTIVYQISAPTELDVLTIVHHRKLYPPQA